MAAAAILDFFEPEIAPLDPPSPKTPYLVQNLERIGRPVAEICHLNFSKMAAAAILDLFEPEIAP